MDLPKNAVIALEITNRPEESPLKVSTCNLLLHNMCLYTILCLCIYGESYTQNEDRSTNKLH